MLGSCASSNTFGRRVLRQMDVSIMIEGQNGLTWLRWQGLGHAVEALGFAGLFRSDHFTNASPPDRDSLELWTSLTWLAANTSRVRLGPLVTPCSFRHPVMTARMATAVDDLSGGRLILGLGAGWEGRGHTNYGFEGPPPGAGNLYGGKGRAPNAGAGRPPCGGVERDVPTGGALGGVEPAARRPPPAPRPRSAQRPPVDDDRPRLWAPDLRGGGETPRARAHRGRDARAGSHRRNAGRGRRSTRRA